MNGDTLFEALSHVGADLIDRACENPASDRPKKTRHPFGRRLAAIAGCACFLLVGSILFARFFPGSGNVPSSGLMLMAVDAHGIDIDELNANVGFTPWTEENTFYIDETQPESVEIGILGEIVSGTYSESVLRAGSLVPFHRYLGEDNSEFYIKPDGTLAQYSGPPMKASERRNAGERIADADALARARDLFEKLTPYHADDYSVSVTQRYESSDVIEVIFQKTLDGVSTADWAKIYLYKNGRPIDFVTGALGMLSDHADQSFDFNSVDREVIAYCDNLDLFRLIKSLDYYYDVGEQDKLAIVNYSDWSHQLTADEQGQFHVVVSVVMEVKRINVEPDSSIKIGLTFVSPQGVIHVVSATPETPVEEIADPSEGLTYASNGDGTCSVTGIGTFTGNYLVIPDTSPDGDTVTAVADRAFEGNQTVEYLVLPDTLKSIGIEAFSGCPIRYLNLGNGVEYIGGSAFNSVRIKSLVIPDSVKTIDEGAFCWCSRLTNVSIGNGLITLAQQAFANSHNVRYAEYENGIYLGNRSNPYLVLVDVADDTCTSFIIHPGTRALAAKAFSGCSNLTAVTLPDGLIGIGSYAFNICTSLQSIVIPSGVTMIPDHAFYDCLSLVSVVLPDGILSIGEEAFAACFNLTDFQIPPSVTEIGKGAFARCESLTSVTIPAGITQIPGYAFVGCSALTEATIPAGVTFIGYCAFYNCRSLTSITFSSSGTWTIRHDDELIRVYPEFAGDETTVSTGLSPAENAENLTQTYVYWVWEKN